MHTLKKIESSNTQRFYPTLRVNTASLVYVKCFSFLVRVSEWERRGECGCVCWGVCLRECIKIWLGLIYLWMFHSMMFVVYLVFYVGRHLDCFSTLLYILYIVEANILLPLFLSTKVFLWNGFLEMEFEG